MTDHMFNQMVDIMGMDAIVEGHMLEDAATKVPISFLTLLDQDKVWFDQSGKRWLLPDMTPSHVINLLAYLRRRKGTLKFAYDLKWAFLCASAWERGEAAQDAVDRSYEALLDTEPEEWLEETPLMVALIELNKRHFPHDV